MCNNFMTGNFNYVKITAHNNDFSTTHPKSSQEIRVGGLGSIALLIIRRLAGWIVNRLVNPCIHASIDPSNHPLSSNNTSLPSNYPVLNKVSTTVTTQTDTSSLSKVKIKKGRVARRDGICLVFPPLCTGPIWARVNPARGTKKTRWCCKWVVFANDFAMAFTHYIHMYIYIYIIL